MLGTKRPRSRNDRFDVDQLIQDLSPLARMKRPPFGDWEMAEYAKCRRAQAPDRDGLARYACLISILLDHAPGCYPNQKLLAIVFIELNKQFCIRDTAFASQSILDWGNACSNTARLLLAHLLDLHRTRSSYVHPTLKELCSKIGDEEDAGSAWHESPDTSIAVPEPIPIPDMQLPRTLAQHDSIASSQNSVEICAAYCRCPTCMARHPEPPIVVAPEENDADSLSDVAANNLDHVPPVRGSHKRAAKEKRSDTTPDSILRRPATAGSIVRRPAAATGFKIVRRLHGNLQAYILNRGRYVASCSQKRSPHYINIIATLKGELEAGLEVARAKDGVGSHYIGFSGFGIELYRPMVSELFRICPNFSELFRICPNCSRIFRICPNYSESVRIYPNVSIVSISFEISLMPNPDYPIKCVPPKDRVGEMVVDMSTDDVE